MEADQECSNKVQNQTLKFTELRACENEIMLLEINFNFQNQISDQQSSPYHIDDILLHQIYKTSINIDSKSSIDIFSPQNQNIRQFGQIHLAHDQNQDFEMQNDIGGMSFNIQFQVNQDNNKSGIPYNSAQCFVNFPNEQSFEQCDCNCKISYSSCQNCKCWPSCAFWKKQKSSTTNFCCFCSILNKEKSSADYKEVSDEKIQIEDEQSQPVTSSIIMGGIEQSNQPEILENQTAFNFIQQIVDSILDFEWQIDSFTNQIDKFPDYRRESQRSCRCKNKNCADERCVCRKRGMLCRPECGCIHQDCKNQSIVQQKNSINPTKLHRQAVMEEQELRKQLPDMEFEPLNLFA